MDGRPKRRKEPVFLNFSNEVWTSLTIAGINLKKVFFISDSNRNTLFFSIGR